jgi:hypothetical protein
MISQSEKMMLVNFIQRTLNSAPADLDEGIGTVYERQVIDAYFRQILARYEIASVLESPADGVTGMPGINSLEFARNGCDVCLTNPVQKMLDQAELIWQKNNLSNKVSFLCCDVDELPIEDDSFDLVWNYCMFERFLDPETLLTEMRRVARKYVMVLTQNVYNAGTLIHMLYHKLHGLHWDHGYTHLMKLKSITASMERSGINIIETGTVDIPPWMDTWDMPMRGQLKKWLGLFGKKWEWKIDGESTNHSVNSNRGVMARLQKMEDSLPRWFKSFQTHHLYILGAV